MLITTPVFNVIVIQSVRAISSITNQPHVSPTPMKIPMYISSLHKFQAPFPPPPAPPPPNTPFPHFFGLTHSPTHLHPAHNLEAHPPSPPFHFSSSDRFPKSQRFPVVNYPGLADAGGRAVMDLGLVIRWSGALECWERWLCRFRQMNKA